MLLPVAAKLLRPSHPQKLADSSGSCEIHLAMGKGGKGVAKAKATTVSKDWLRLRLLTGYSNEPTHKSHVPVAIAIATAKTASCVFKKTLD